MGKALGLLLWIITAAAVWMFAVKKWWFPESITEHGSLVDAQFMRTLFVVAAAFVLAQVALGFVVFRFGGGKQGAATYSHGSNKLEVTWTLITAAVFVTLGVLGQQVWASLHFHDAPAGSLTIEVTAQQFAWNFRYAGADGVLGKTDPKLMNDSTGNPLGRDSKDPAGDDDIVASTITVPANRPVKLILKSKDVIHSFFVPNLRFKQDLVPGMSINVHFTPMKPGHYELACAELCGAGHYKMKSYMDVLPEDDFEKWLKDKGTGK